jgi:hypothetical protein
VIRRKRKANIGNETIMADRYALVNTEPKSLYELYIELVVVTSGSHVSTNVWRSIDEELANTYMLININTCSNASHIPTDSGRGVALLRMG